MYRCRPIFRHKQIFNDYDKEDGFRSFITTQPIKKLKGHLKDWALDSEGWQLYGDNSGKTFSLNDLDEEADKNKIYFKSRWIRESSTIKTDGAEKKAVIEQKLIVSYSIKYRDYLRSVRNHQIARAEPIVGNGSKSVGHKRQNDPKRFIKTDYAPKDGEIANVSTSYIDERQINKEEQYDGFYAVFTNLNDDPDAIVKVNKRRWEIEECFRIIKSDFEARPVYVKRQERILAHFITCFIALIIYKYLEKKLDDKYTINQILPTLQEMDFVKHTEKGYQPIYTRTELTDDLHNAFGFCTSKQIIPTKKMRNICSQTKNRKSNV